MKGINNFLNFIFKFGLTIGLLGPCFEFLRMYSPLGPDLVGLTVAV